MSRLQTAIQKISGAKSGELPSGEQRRRSASARLDSKRKGIRTGETVPFHTSIKLDFDRLEEEGIVVVAEQNPELRGQFRRIKWPVIANAFGDQSDLIPRGSVVMVASATAGEGKTFSALNLAISIAAERDIEVLLVDADVAKPHITNLFGARDFPGLTDYLRGDASDISDVILGTNIAGLHLLPAGRRDEEASELLASQRMDDLVNELDKRFPNTMILFDTSPILQTNESQVLSRLVGQVLLVVAANKTPRPAVQEAVSLLGPDLIVNVIFNRVRSFLKQQYRYGGYYGYQQDREPD